MYSDICKVHVEAVLQYTSVAPFLNHLQKSSQEHLLSVYTIFIKDLFEGKYLAGKILEYSKVKPVYLSSFEETISYMQEGSLFISSEVMVATLGRLSTKESRLLEKAARSYAASDKGKAVFIFTEKVLPFVFQEIGAVLDLLGGKRWDVEKRRSFYLQERAKKRATALHPTALSALFKSSDLDLPRLFSVADALFSYTLGRQIITQEDVKKVALSTVEQSVWQKAERFVWEKKPVLVDKSAFSLFFIALRKQMQMGYILSLFADPMEGKALFPKVWPSLFETRARQVKRLGKSYFLRGRKAVFSAEYTFRTTGVFDPFHLYAHVHFTS